MLSGLTEGLSTVWLGLDRAVHPLYWLTLIAFVLCSVLVVCVSIVAESPDGPRHRLARLEITWTLLTAALVLGLATGSLRTPATGPVRLAALLQQTTGDDPEVDADGQPVTGADEGGATGTDAQADTAGGSDAAAAPDDQPTDAPADDGSTFPVDQEPAGADVPAE
jgi:hypothetical protein